MKCPWGTWDCWRNTTPNATFWRTDSRSCVRTGVRLSLIVTTRITSTSALLFPVRVRWMLKWNNSKFPRMAILFVWSYPISKKASARAWIRETDRQRQGEGVFCTCLCYTHTPTSTLEDTESTSNVHYTLLYKETLPRQFAFWSVDGECRETK